jgi:hypothetical protein
MTEPAQDSATASATALLGHYGFELAGYTPQELVARWIKNYQAIWVRLAVIEALYQGRYKAVSVEQILSNWSRRGRPLYHFNHDFERLICRKFPYALTTGLDTPGEVETNLPIAALTLNVPVLPEEASQTEGSAIAVFTPAPEEVTEIPVTLETPVLETIDEPPLATTEPDQEAKYEADWSRWEVSKRPINQFTPSSEVSDFYLKLKAVSLGSEVADEQAIAPANSEQPTEPG